MEKRFFENTRLLDSSIEKFNKKTYEAYLFQVKSTQYIIVRRRSLIPAFTTKIIELTKNLKTTDTKTLYRFYDKHEETLKNTKECEFVKGSVTFVTRDGETYKFRLFGGFFNLIKSGFFII